MKKLLFWGLVFSSFVASAQFSGKHYAKKAGNAQQRNQETARAINQAPEGPPPQSKTAPPPSQSQQTSSNKAKVVIPEKSAEAKQDIVQRTVEIQRKRAEKGDAIAQYDYGMRLLRGEGLEKNMDEARKWLKRSADQGNSLAKKQLAEIEKKENEAVWSKDDESDKKKK